MIQHRARTAAQPLDANATNLTPRVSRPRPGRRRKWRSGCHPETFVGAALWRCCSLLSASSGSLRARMSVTSGWRGRRVQRRAVAVRMALGATRTRLVQRWVIESLAAVSVRLSL
jgi:hypothetical protein